MYKKEGLVPHNIFYVRKLEKTVFQGPYASFPCGALSIFGDSVIQIYTLD